VSEGAILSPIEERAVAILIRMRGECTASTLGEELWARKHSCGPAAYARPAGRLLRRLQRRGLVSCQCDGTHYRWKAEGAGPRGFWDALQEGKKDL
jgi:predicted transcriptional regulator